MKLHLPYPLRKALLATFPLLLAALGTTHSSASMMRDEASITTYTDFGQNMGRYVVGDKVNALLQHIRTEAGGAEIEYRDGTTYVMTNGMIDFSSAGDAGHPGSLTDYGKIVTVKHNGELSPMFSSETGIRYRAIEFRYGSNFLNASPIFDFKVSRLSKIVTDVEASPTYSGPKNLAGQQLFHTGSGWQCYLTEDGWQRVCGPYQYNSGGVDKVYSVPAYYGNENQLFIQYYMSESAGSAAPLPYLGQTGDSGSSFWVWNNSTRQYEYAGTYALLSSDEGGCDPKAVGASALDRQYMAEVNAKYTSAISSGATGGLRISAGVTDEASYTDVISNVTYTGTERYSLVTDTEGNTLGKLYRLSSGLNTWAALNDVKDRDNWYAENGESGHLLVSNDSSATSVPTRMDLFLTKDSRFTAAGAETYTLELAERVDTGIGAAQFSKAAGVDHATFILKAAEGAAEGMLNTAGYIVDEGVELHLQFSNPENYMREWRKVGAGDLYVDGTGDTNAMLNLGGTGMVYLDQVSGHAAYNVLANTGATVVLRGGTGQIARDFTFGNGRSYLDFYGHDMVWNNSSAVADAGFHIHALTEEGRITNSLQGTLSTITVTDGGPSFSGSFADDRGGALKVVYRGAGDKAWQLTGIHTDLSRHVAEGSGFEVQSGSVRLGGTHTVHATGSLSGRNTERYANVDDWHYADAKMDVTVAQGATFTLGSHARLDGKVTVQGGGTLVLEEGVRHAQEYVEGSIHLEETAKYKDYYGLKGDIVNNGSVQVQYSAGTDTGYLYGHNVSGSGTMRFDLGLDGGTFTMTGTASTGKKTVASGGVVVHAAGLGSTGETWLVEEKGFLAVHGMGTPAAALNRVDADSKGVLALTEDCSTQFNLSGHKNLIIGAYGEREIRYGAEDTQEKLEAVDHQWHLGGGGGTLVVNYLLDDAEGTLVLGNEYTTGTVKLTNTGNNFQSIKAMGGVTLDAGSSAIGRASVEVGYSSRVLENSGVFERVTGASDGVVVMDGEHIGADMSAHGQMALGTTGNSSLESIRVQDDSAYRFGGITGTLAVNTALESGHDLVVDNQTYRGGTVELNGASALDGKVAVMGYDSGKSDGSRGGDITLVLGSEGMLDHATAVKVENGGTLDVNGHNQAVQDLHVGETGMVADRSSGPATVTLSGTADVAGEVNVGNIARQGNATATITGTVVLQDKQGGNANMQDFSWVENHGTLSLALTGDNKNVVNLGSGSANGRVELRSGSISYLSNLGEASTLVMSGGTQLLFGEKDGDAGDHSFHSDIVLQGNAELKVWGTNYHRSATISGNVSGNYTLTKNDGNQKTVFTGEVDLARLNVSCLDAAGQMGSVEFTNSAQIGTIQDNKGIIGVQGSGSLTVDLLSMKADGSLAGRAGDGSMSYTVTSGGSGSVTHATITADSITGADGADARVDNATIDLALGSRLELANITLGAGSRITDAAATLVANGLVVEAGVGTNLVYDGLKPLTYGDAAPAAQQESGSVAAFTLTNVQDVNIEGDRLVISVLGSADGLGGADWISVSLAENGTFDDNLNVTMLYTDAEGQQRSVQGVYSIDDVALAAEAAQPHDYVYFHLAGAAGVPEPASATLALLALAALAARRRRKG